MFISNRREKCLKSQTKFVSDYKFHSLQQIGFPKNYNLRLFVFNNQCSCCVHESPSFAELTFTWEIRFDEKINFGKFFFTYFCPLILFLKKTKYCSCRKSQNWKAKYLFLHDIYIESRWSLKEKTFLNLIFNQLSKLREFLAPEIFKLYNNNVINQGNSSICLRYFPGISRDIKYHTPSPLCH